LAAFFMVKCKREACEPKAVGSDGKPLNSEKEPHGEVSEGAG
jgi:hypothetical protein